MRVKIGRRVHTCSLATHPEASEILLLSIRNEVYTVVFNRSEAASECLEKLLKNGYCDISDYTYSNCDLPSDLISKKFSKNTIGSVLDKMVEYRNAHTKYDHCPIGIMDEKAEAMDVAIELLRAELLKQHD